MRLRAVAVFVLSLLALAAPAGAQLEVPGDYDTVQEALDAAPADSTIVIHGGTWRELVVTKPVTLVGDPAPLITLWCSSTGGAIFLDGPGHGAVVLENLHVEYESQAETCGNPPPLIAGDGFEQLLVLSSTLLGSHATGLDPAHGNGAITVTVDSLLVADSTIEGGNSTTCAGCCTGNCYVPSASHAICAWTADVTVLDSTVSGGSADDQIFVESVSWECPTSCADLGNGGHGGTGISALSVFVANSTIVGGSGGTYGCNVSALSCQQPSGVPIAASQIELLSGSLTAAGAPHLGGDWPLTWVTSAPMAFLALSLTVTAPTDLGPKGWLYMNPDEAIVYVVPGGQQSQSFGVPNDPDLLGVVLTVQVLDPGEGLSRPVVVPFLP